MRFMLGADATWSLFGAGRRTGEPLPFAPIRVTIVDVAAEIPPLPTTLGDDGCSYGEAASYVQWSGTAIGVAWTKIPAGGVDAADHAASIWSQLANPLQAEAARTNTPAQILTSTGLEPIDRHTDPGRRLPHVTVIVATRDRPGLLSQCLRSLRELRYPDYDVLVVDNAPSSDSTVRLLNELGPEAGIGLVREDRPGLAVAHNRGVEAATGEIVAFTDDDVLVDENWLGAIVRAFQSVPDAGCVTGLIVPRDLKTKAQWWLEGFAGFSKGFERRYYDLRSNRPRDPLFPYAAGNLGSGANMAFRRDVLREIGGFDPALGIGSGAYGGDDLASFFEVVDAGHTLVYEPGAMVQHEHPATQQALGRQVFGYGAGLTAYLTSTVARRPRRLLALVSRLPRALWYGLSANSARNSRRAPDFPRRLRLNELAGMAVGPIAYLRARRRSRATALRR